MSLRKDGEESNRLLGVARLAMRLGGDHLSDYGAVTSRKDFTRRQLMACLVLRAYLKTTYRGVIEILETSEALRTELGMKEKLPHYSTLAKFCERSAVLDILGAMLHRLGQASLRHEKQPVAINATGLETSTASAHLVCRSKKERKKWVKPRWRCSPRACCRWVQYWTGAEQRQVPGLAAAATVALGPAHPTAQALRRRGLRRRVGAYSNSISGIFAPASFVRRKTCSDSEYETMSFIFIKGLFSKSSLFKSNSLNFGRTIEVTS
jgi:hypothetical protein